MIGFKVYRSIPTSLDLNGPVLSWSQEPVGIITGTSTAQFIGSVTSTPEGTGHLSYQWYEVGVGAIGGGSTAAVGVGTTLTLSGLESPTDTGRQFYLQADYVASAYGSTPVTAGTARSTANALNGPLISDAVDLTMLPTISITTQPFSVTSTVDADTDFSVVATTDDSTDSELVYNWTLGGDTLTDGNFVIEGTGCGDAVFATPGTHTWVCPEGVTSVSAVAVGAGCQGSINVFNGSGGGGLGWRNNIEVTPGESYTVQVGRDNYPGGDSWFKDTATVLGGGGQSNVGGTYVGDGGSAGQDASAHGGGGGAGGYGSAREGGGGRGGSTGLTGGGAGGGGVGLYGQGATGQDAEDTASVGVTLVGGGGGSGGAAGQSKPGAIWVEGVTPTYGPAFVRDQNYVEFFKGTFTYVFEGVTVGTIRIGVPGENEPVVSGGKRFWGGSIAEDNGNTWEEPSYYEIRYIDDANSTGSRYLAPTGGGNGGDYGGGGGGRYQEGSAITGNASNAGKGGVRIMWGTGRAYPDTLTNEPGIIKVSGANTSTLTLNAEVAGIHTVTASISHPRAYNSPLQSTVVHYDVMGSGERKVLYMEEFDVNAVLYTTKIVNLLNEPLQIIPEQGNDSAYGNYSSPLTMNSNWNRIYSIYAPEEDIDVRITLAGSAGQGINEGGVFSTHGGEGGVTTWDMTLVRQQEYVVNLGGATWPSGGWGPNGHFGGGGSFFYRGGKLLMACGGGGGSSTGSGGGRGGGAGLNGENAWGYNTNGNIYNIGGQGVTGELPPIGLWPGDQTLGTFPSPYYTAQTPEGGRVGGCTIGDYWQTQGIAPCADIGSTTVFTGINGQQTTTFGIPVNRGYKAGLNYQWNGGNSLAQQRGAGGGGGANGGGGGNATETGAGGGGSGYNSGEFTGSAIISNTVGGNDMKAGYIKIEVV